MRVKEYFDANALFEDENFYDDFCRDCPAKERFSMLDMIRFFDDFMTKSSCPVEWEIENEKCFRHDKYKEIVWLIEDFNDNIARILNQG